MKRLIQPSDLHIVRRMRLQRILIGMSQVTLAAQLGVSFQLVQKYEAGLTRIGSGRLHRAAKVLGVEVTFFFAGVSSHTISSNEKADVISLADTPEGMRLFKAFARVRCQLVRRRLLSLIEVAAGG